MNMNELIEQAQREGKWLHNGLGEWISPREWAEGVRPTWVIPVNWTLADPQEYLSELKRRALQASRRVEVFEARLRAEEPY